MVDTNPASVPSTPPQRAVLTIRRDAPSGDGVSNGVRSRRQLGDVVGHGGDCRDVVEASFRSSTNTVSSSGVVEVEAGGPRRVTCAPVSLYAHMSGRVGALLADHKAYDGACAM